MSDTKSADAKSALLETALKHAVFDGFSEKTLARAAEDAGIDRKDAIDLFPEGASSLVEEFSRWTDAETERRLKDAKLDAMSIREKIALAVRLRIAVLKPHKEAARRAAAFLTLPMHAALGAKLLYRTSDSIWRGIGDSSTDFNFYTKRGILGGLLSATMIRWFTDTSENDKDTMDFLHARIENVMQMETLKAKMREAAKKMPTLSEILKPSVLKR